MATYGGPVRTTQEGMQRAYSRFDAESQGFQHLKSQIEGEMSAFLSTWGGQAGTAFGGAMNTWSGNFSVIIQQLEALKLSMQQNAKDYALHEEENVTEAQTFAQGLPGI